MKLQSQTDNSWMMAKWNNSYGFGNDGRIEGLVNGSDGILAAIEDLEKWYVSKARDDEKTKLHWLHVNFACSRKAMPEGVVQSVGKLWQQRTSLIQNRKRS